VSEGALRLELAVRQRAPITLDAALECAPGELTALVGPSGSGKTTLLRVVAGLNRPQEGFVRCGGRSWFDSRQGVDLPPQQRRVGLVFQNYALFPHLSALDNVATALGHLPAAQRGARARELLEQMHLSGLEQRRPGQLSGGQQQRVAVARALARDPAVLLLDEPFSAVDQVTRGKLQRELALLRGRLRVPVLLVTHDLDEARLLADRIAIIHRGATLQSGTPDEVLLRPKSGDVARLVGLYNVFAGTVAALTPEGGASLRWRGHILEVRHNPGFAPGERVEWVVPSRFVILHRRDKPSQGERENPVAGTCIESIMLGDQALVSLALDGDGSAPLSFSIPAHTARRNGVAAGAALTVSLLAEGIHLMPAKSPHPTTENPNEAL
jgi:molybdate transport system ATP-binding protein